MAMQDDIQQFGKELIQWQGPRVLGFEQTLDLLQSEHRQIRMWAVYQLIECWQERAAEFVHLLLESDIAESREAAIYLVGRYHLKQFAFPIFGLFNRSKGSLKHSSAVALVELKYSAFKPALSQWFRHLWESEELQLADLQCAIKCLVQSLNSEIWDELEAALWEQRENHMKALCLFGYLCQSVQSSDQIERLMRHYRFFRVHFTDPQFFQHLASIFDCAELIRWFQAQLQFGKSLQELYPECLYGLSMQIDVELSELLARLDLLRRQQEITSLLQALEELMCFSLDHPELTSEWLCLQEFKELVATDWDSTILKIQDQEFLLLLCLPVSAWLSLRETEFLERSRDHMASSLRLYQSPLLRETWMRMFLRDLLLQPNELRQFAADASMSPVPGDPRQALLRLVGSGSIERFYPFPLVLPRPWQYRLTELMEQLTAIYEKWFPDLVQSRQHEHLDYALELFIRYPTSHLIDQVVEHFPLLIHHHFDQLLNLIEKVPDERFLENLLGYYRKGENSVRQLLCLLCLLHGKEDLMPSDEEVVFRQEIVPHVRIFCQKCQSAYHYPIQKLYIDAELVEQRRLLQDQDLWMPEKLNCKNCHGKLEFRTDARFRATLFSEVLTAKMLKLTDEEAERMQAFQLLDFPRLNNRKCNPQTFLNHLDRLLEQSQITSVEKARLLLEAGKLYLSLEWLSKAKEALRRSLELQGDQPRTLYHLGELAYREHNLFDARLYFSQLLQVCTPEDFLLEDDNLYQLASHYLEILDRREYKRGSFKLVVNLQET